MTFRVKSLHKALPYTPFPFSIATKDLLAFIQKVIYL